MKYLKTILLIIFILLLCQNIFASPTVRIKDIATIHGIRENQLLGIGIITGLAGKGDSSSSALIKKILSNLLTNFGISINENDVNSKNCAVVMVSADMPGFLRSGNRIDVTVSSIGDARSLEGGILLQTNLKAANGLVYAVAQGKILVPDARDSVKTTGRIINGAISEREILSQYVQDGRIFLILRNPDFQTANSITTAITEAFQEEEIQVNSLDPSQVEIVIPESRLENIVSFISEIEQLTIIPDSTGKVIIDSQSGIIIMGENVRIGTVAVSYESVNVTVGSSFFGEDENPNHFIIEDTTNVNDFITTLKSVGIKTPVLIEILKAIDKAGALYGILIII